MKKTILTVIAISSMIAGAEAAVISSTDFGTLANGTTITTTNTPSLTYARVSTGANGALVAVNPSPIDSGAAASLFASTTSLTGVGVGSGLAFGGGGNVGTIAFDLLTPTAYGSGSIFFGVGSGATFTGNSTFASADLTAGFQIVNGQLQSRTGSNTSSTWTNVGGATAFATNTEYDISISFNGSGSTITYGDTNQFSIASFKADIWVNGSLFADDIAIKSQLPTGGTNGYRIYTVSDSAGAPYVIDNISINDAAVAVPEPTTTAMLLGGAGAMFWIIRRKRSIKA